MNIIEKINRKKDFIASELYQWAETFEYELDEDGEKTLDSYNFTNIGFIKLDVENNELQVK